MNLNLDCDIAKEILITSAYINSINIPNDLFYEIVSLAADSKKMYISILLKN